MFEKVADKIQHVLHSLFSSLKIKYMVREKILSVCKRYAQNLLQMVQARSACQQHHKKITYQKEILLYIWWIVIAASTKSIWTFPLRHSPSDNYLFLNLQLYLQGSIFNSAEKAISEVDTFFESRALQFRYKGLYKLRK